MTASEKQPDPFPAEKGEDVTKSGTPLLIMNGPTSALSSGIFSKRLHHHPNTESLAIKTDSSGSPTRFIGLLLQAISSKRSSKENPYVQVVSFLCLASSGARRIFMDCIPFPNLCYRIFYHVPVKF
ncbi:hypothetical protein M5689_002701 [Euphorbia peplus]|nr:hypothetical protein M5689_002701 [Euphorbia peplus]